MLALMGPPVRFGRSRLRAAAARWPRAVSGVAAVEFALVLPVMLTLFWGLSEVTLAVNIDRKLTLTSRSIADLSSRVSLLSTSDLATIFSASSAVMRPYDSSSTQMVVTSVLVTVSGSTYTGTVDWSCGKNLATKLGTQTQADFDAINLKVRASGTTYAVPAGFQATTTKSFILVETLQPYTPVFGRVMTGTIQLRETTPWPVRNSDKVTGPSSCPT